MINVTIVSENLCTQLMNLQKAIAAREDGCPTFQEINMQVKIINSIDRLSRFAARQAKEEARMAAAATTQAVPQPEHVYDGPPPVTAADADDIDKVLDELQEAGATVTFKGQVVPLEWLTYNLFQFSLPVLERSFATEPKDMLIEEPTPADKELKAA